MAAVLHHVENILDKYMYVKYIPHADPTSTRRTGHGRHGSGGPHERRWNGVEGQAWVAYQPHYDAMLGPLGDRALDAAGLAPGASVLDVGCGCGATTIAAAGLVGPDGTVVGADRSAPMLQRARERVATLGLRTVELLLTDAGVHRFPLAAYDAIVSRFGLMLFADPAEVFARLARSLRPGGRLAFVTWRDPGSNAWFTLPLAAAAEHVDLGRADVPGGPGPFAFADPDLVRNVLGTAGFTDVELTPVDDSVWTGADAADAAAFFEGANGHKLAAAAGPDLMAQVVDTLRARLEQFAGPDGVRLPAAAWLVTARR
jgi:SAM-dependent methyltransferase